MERVAFLVESTGQKIGCMLNPETIVIRRLAGVRPRRSAGGLVSGGALVDDPLLYIGGGTTEIELDLLFDVTIDGSANGGSNESGPAIGRIDASPVDPALAEASGPDVRLLTRPLQQLTEKPPADSRAAPSTPPVVRLIWGKGWNVPGVIVALAERFDYFTPDGLPQRSWLRMRLRRVAEAVSASDSPAASSPLPDVDLPLPAVDPESVVEHSLQGGGASLDSDPQAPAAAAERLDEIAFRYYGRPDAWRFIASFNNLDDPAQLPSGSTLQIPPRSAWSGS